MPIAPRLSRTSLYWLCSTLAGTTLCVLVYLVIQIVLSFYSYSADQFHAWKMERRNQDHMQASLTQLDIVDDLIKGKCTIEQAVHRLRGLQHKNVDDKTLSRRLLNIVSAKLRDRPEQRAAVLRRLHAQLGE